MQRRKLLQMATAATFIPISTWAQTGHKPNGYIRTNWSKDPYSYGSYSYVAKGARNKDRITIGESQNGRVFFAGEACDQKSGSGVHSAYQSGIKTADEILSAKIKQVTIIGAGISGLSAAHRLSAAGVDVTVIEARDRIGGRIHTDDQTLDSTVDLGASWIHNAQKHPMMGIVEELGIQTVNTPSDGVVVRGGDGQKMAKSDLPEWMSDVQNFHHGLGATEDQVNIWAYLLDTAIDGDQLVFPKGYHEVFKAFEGSYSMSMSETVSDVITRENDVVLKTSKGQYNSQAVLVTVPLGVLKAGAIRFDPPLPEAKLRSISKMGMGLLDKVYLQFDSVFWDQDATIIATPDTGLPNGQFNEWVNFYPLFGAPILMAFNGAKSAYDLADLPDEDVLSRAMQALNLAYPQ